MTNEKHVISGDYNRTNNKMTLNYNENQGSFDVDLSALVENKKKLVWYEDLN